MFFSLNLKTGFTLAEVLVTIGIIGIVAAITLPSIIQKWRNKVLETEFNKAISLASQVIYKSKTDIGLEKFTTYCTEFDNIYTNSQECYKILYKNLLGVENQINYATENAQYINRASELIKTYNDKQIISSTSLAAIGVPIFQTYVLNNGSYVNFYINEHNLYIGIDTNAKKKPNKLGHDIFILKINEKNDFVVATTTKPLNLTEEELNNYTEGYIKERAGHPCNLTSNQKGNGLGCAYYALKDECPYDSNKKYFDCLP